MDQANRNLPKELQNLSSEQIAAAIEYGKNNQNEPEVDHQESAELNQAKPDSAPIDGDRVVASATLKEALEKIPEGSMDPKILNNINEGKRELNISEILVDGKKVDSPQALLEQVLNLADQTKNDTAYRE